MQRKELKFNRLQKIGIAMIFFSSILFISTPKQVEAANLGGPSHIGTFEGSTTFTTSSSNGVNPGLYLEVMDRYGNYKEYTSEDGVITVDDTKEGAYVTQAKLLGKTKYRDIHTGELLDQWEAGRDLRLESSKMPVLTTTGKNMFDINGEKKVNGTGFSWEIKGNKLIVSGNGVNGTVHKWNNIGILIDGLIVGDWYTLSYEAISDTENAYSLVSIYYPDGSSYGNVNGLGNKEISFSPSQSSIIVRFFATNESNANFNQTVTFSNFQLEQGSKATSYEPYKSNILSTSEDVELRGIGDVKDELNLLTGEVVERIGEIVLDGSQTLQPHSTVQGDTLMIKISDPSISFKQNSNLQESWDFSDMICDKELIAETPKWNANEWNEGYNIALISSASSNTYNINSFVLAIRKSYFNVQSIDEFKTWLTQNPLTIQYKLAKESIKTVVLTSDYYFQPVMNRDVHIDGTILPLVCSVTIPTEHLSFVLNPNEEKGKQFVAPDFSITNNTPASIYLELNTFEQLSNDLNDVLPTEHENWNTLDRKQSKDIALALVPKTSDGWLSLTEGPRYVADSSNYYLGEVKAESSVDFTFEANHGRAFLETLSPRYRLSFIFDFFDK